MSYVVAPRVGAWIEKCEIRGVWGYSPVAPRVGAWIENTGLNFVILKSKWSLLA